MRDNTPDAIRSIPISLTQMQIVRVICDSFAVNGSFSLLLALADPGHELRLPTLAASPAYNAHGISQSLLRGLLILSTFNKRPEQTLKQIADDIEAESSVVRRYLMALITLEMVSQEQPQRPYRVIGCDPRSRYGLLPMLFAFAKPERETWLVDTLNASRRAPKNRGTLGSRALIRGIAVLSTFGAQPIQSRDNVAKRLSEKPSTIAFCLQTLTAVGLLEYELKRYRLAKI